MEKDDHNKLDKQKIKHSNTKGSKGEWDLMKMVK